MTMRTATALAALALAACTACATAKAASPANPAPLPETELTAGLVQSRIAPGMPQPDVAAALGSPNLVSRDAQGREVWIYDRVSTDRVRASRSTRAGVLAIPGYEWASGFLSGLAGASHARESERETTTQKTLTVVVRFDEVGRVASATLHASRF
jgi:outer membrane protein assembly factor BamE (lipoprotein component of BamABCDE complex)